MMLRKTKKSSCGFSLMEVNIAIALISVGLLAIFSLFPLGLRESTLSVEDNHEAMFVNHVLSCMESNALQINDWNTWRSVDSFKTEVVKDIYPVEDGVWILVNSGHGAVNTKARTDMGDGGTGGVKFPASDKLSGKLIRYQLQILNKIGDPVGDDQSIYMIQLKVKSGRYGEFATFHNTYVTLVTFMGS